MMVTTKIHLIILMIVQLIQCTSLYLYINALVWSVYISSQVWMRLARSVPLCMCVSSACI